MMMFFIALLIALGTTVAFIQAMSRSRAKKNVCHTKLRSRDEWRWRIL